MSQRFRMPAESLQTDLRSPGETQEVNHLPPLGSSVLSSRAFYTNRRVSFTVLQKRGGVAKAERMVCYRKTKGSLQPATSSFKPRARSAWQAGRRLLTWARTKHCASVFQPFSPFLSKPAPLLNFTDPPKRQRPWRVIGHLGLVFY